MGNSVIRFPETLPVNSWRWSLNPEPPWTLITIQIQMGGLIEHPGDIPAIGAWEFRSFTPYDSSDKSPPGNSPLFFTNSRNGTWGHSPFSNDTDGDAVQQIREESGGVTTAYDYSWALSDGREVYKYGTNPIDDDTDGDMLPRIGGNMTGVGTSPMTIGLLSCTLRSYGKNLVQPTNH